MQDITLIYLATNKKFDKKIENARIIIKSKGCIQNNCYFSIPMSLCFRASDETIERLRVVLATTYASGEDARDIDTAMEALGWMGLSTPPVQVLLKASGGNEKSAR